MSSHIRAEDELDEIISDLGRCMERAYKDGDPVGAAIYLQRQQAARASRTPEHQARLDAADAQRCDELTFGGQWTEELSGKAA